MNYWIAETTNLDVAQSLFDFLQVFLDPILIVFSC